MREGRVEKRHRIQEQAEVIVQVRVPVGGHIRVEVPVRDEEGRLVGGSEVGSEPEARVLEETDREYGDGLDADRGEGHAFCLTQVCQGSTTRLVASGKPFSVLPPIEVLHRQLEILGGRGRDPVRGGDDDRVDAVRSRQWRSFD